jgi:Sulfotransferase family
LADNPAFPFIVGAPRSGTTLLRFMMDSHPLLAIPPETGFLIHSKPMSREELFHLVTHFPADGPAWQDFGLDAGEFWNALEGIDPFDAAEGLRAFYRLYAAKHHKPYYGDKTPVYCEYIPEIADVFADAHFIHIVRDGRDAALSLRRTWFSPGSDMTTLAAHWRRQVIAARVAGRKSRAYLEVRFEDLLVNPEAVLRDICEFVKLQFHPAMLRYWERTPERLKEHGTRYRSGRVVTHEERMKQQELTTLEPQTDRAFAWKKEMTAAERDEFVFTAGDTLQEFGYAI